VGDKMTVFVGSSTEAARCDLSIQAILEELDVRVRPWQDAFPTGQFTLESLEKTAKEVEGALLVATPDDLVKYRGHFASAPRDNIVFELGLFLGALGRPRAALLVVKTDGKELKLPTDLGGMKHLVYDESKPAQTKQSLGKWVKEVESHVASSVNGRLERILQELENLVAPLQESPDCPMRRKCNQLAIEEVFPQRESAYPTIAQILRSCEHDVDLLGVTLVEAFRNQEVHEAINDRMVHGKGIKWRILLLDPDSESAVFRSLREDYDLYSDSISGGIPDLSRRSLPEVHSLLGQIYTSESQMARDRQEAISYLKNYYRKFQPNLQVRLYRGGAYAQALFFDERLLFLEQYHFGLPASKWPFRAAAKVPAFLFERRSEMFRQMQGHFDYLWDHLSIPLIPDAENRAPT
jgi:hypothetical protein